MQVNIAAMKPCIVICDWYSVMKTYSFGMYQCPVQLWRESGHPVWQTKWLAWTHISLQKNMHPKEFIITRGSILLTFLPQHTVAAQTWISSSYHVWQIPWPRGWESESDRRQNPKLCHPGSRTQKYEGWQRFWEGGEMFSESPWLVLWLVAGYRNAPLE